MATDNKSYYCSKCNKTMGADQFYVSNNLEKYPDEGPVCFQLAASDAIELAEATQRVTQYGADLIDLNCGCPVKKIRSKGAGSSLLTDPTKLYQLISTMKKHTHLPVSIKIRVAGDNKDSFNKDIATVASDAGADFLIVHGRHWTERYNTPCHYEDIQFFVDQLKIPVIGNGDISCSDSLKKMFATGCAGVMVSRAGVGQPWLIRKLTAELNQENFTLPPPQEIGQILMEHVAALITLLNNEKFSILQARKFSKYYARHLPNKLEFHSAINICDNWSDFQAICLNYFV